jgi:hypothetical protein
MNIVQKQFSDALEGLKAGSLSGSLSGEDRIILNRIDVKKEEAKESETTEATGSGSAGGFVGPLSGPKMSMWADEAPKRKKPKGGFVEVKEEKLKGGKADNLTIEDLSKKHKVSKDEVYDRLVDGMKEEMEHTDEISVAKEIAMDHLFQDINYYAKLKKIEKGEFKEATSSASSGSYETPAFLAKSMNKKNWRGGAKPLYKGGKFVRVKKKCKTFPYCNQGDIKALDLWEDDIMKEAIKNVAKNKQISENVVRAIVLHEIEKQLFGD